MLLVFYEILKIFVNMSLNFLVFIFMVIASIHASIDERTSPKAFYIAQQFNLAANNESFTCPFIDKLTTECDTKETYRSFDGVCNNLRNPGLGSIETPYKRLLSPQYDDGFSEIRKKFLPPARLASTVLNSDPLNIQERIWTHMWVIFGQFIVHDITSTAVTNC
jgi:hypothetical protein